MRRDEICVLIKAWNAPVSHWVCLSVHYLHTKREQVLSHGRNRVKLVRPCLREWEKAHGKLMGKKTGGQRMRQPESQ